MTDENKDKTTRIAEIKMEIRDRIGRILLHKVDWDEVDDNFDIEKAKEFLFNWDMKMQGESRCFASKEEYAGIDISHYLDMIRYEQKENAMILAIKDGRVIEYVKVAGDEEVIDANAYFKQGVTEKMAHWLKKDADLCNYHNHPGEIAARPSSTDINNLSPSIARDNEALDVWHKLEETYQIFLPSDFCYAEWGVVTEFDFFSMRQNIGLLDSIMDEDEEVNKKIKEYYQRWNIQ